MPVINEKDLGELLTVREAAELLHVHHDTLRRYIAAKDIDAIRVGRGQGRLRLTRRACLDYLNRHRATS